MRQGRVEGGFNGRSNKLVDGCYSWWQGGVFPLLDMYYAHADAYLAAAVGEPVTVTAHSKGGWLFDQLALQEYLLCACQAPGGGLVDKPGKPRDTYHTCYTLSGLSIAQHNPFYYPREAGKLVLGLVENELLPCHPVYNVGPLHVQNALLHFSQLDLPLHL